MHATPMKMYDGCAATDMPNGWFFTPKGCLTHALS